MKLGIITALLILSGVPASAVIALGPSAQNFGLKGIGPNSSGQGQSLMSWGSCTFDGSNTTCTLSGDYTGFGSGGKYSLNVSYAGNGTFPLNAVSQTAGSDLFYASATNNFTFAITLTQNSGPALFFYSFANFSIYFTPAAACTGVPATGCSVGQVGLNPNSTIAGPVTGTFDPSPFIRTSQGVITAGGYGGFASIAPATWIEIYGFNLANTRSQTWSGADFAGNQAPSVLSGVTVTIGGKSAYVNFISPEQINVQVPSDVPTGPQPVVVKTAGGTSNTFTVNVNAVQPGLLAPPSFIINGRQNVVALFSNTYTFVLPNIVPGVTTARARVGDTITFYGVGFGLVSPNMGAGQIIQQTNSLVSDFKVTFAGVPAVVTYAGLGPGNVGLYQFNVTVPSVAASDNVSLAFTLNGVAGTQNLVIAIQN